MHHAMDSGWMYAISPSSKFFIMLTASVATTGLQASQASSTTTPKGSLRLGVHIRSHAFISSSFAEDEV